MHLTRQELAKRLPTFLKIHFIGITSPFCSFSASHLLSKGIAVTASEANQDSEAAQKWIERKVLHPGAHNADFITPDVDLVIFPNGILPGNPEVEKVIEMDLPYVLVQELLGVISTQYKTIAIAGTHGKTTTTALVVWLLHKTLGTPNYIIGDAKDRIAELNNNWEAHPESEYLVIEACEYKKQFLDRAPAPYISVITHIDLDHTDFYPTQESYNQAFAEFLTSTKKAIILDDTKINEQTVLTQIHKTHNFHAVVLDIRGIEQEFVTIESPLLFGKHNQQNLLRAAGVGLLLGLPKQQIRESLKSFPGVSSRFELKGKTKNGALIYKDFAHNPEKITACLQGAKEAYPEKHLVVVYQPHNFERTYTSQEGLIKGLSLADVIILPNIYSIRESEETRSLITSTNFAQNIKNAYPEKEILYTNDIAPYPKTLAETKKFDNEQTLLLIMSAGDVDKIIPELLS